MADKIIVEIYKNKNTEELSKILADPESRLEVGSAAAVSAAMAAALMERAASVTAETVKNNVRLDYILRNSETIRNYMVYLIDEDVKSRGPLRKAVSNDDKNAIEASRQPAVCIPAEIINMMSQSLDLMLELSGMCPKEAMHYIAEAAHLAMGSIRSCRVFIVNMSDGSADETYRFVTRRENEITLSHCDEVCEKILSRLEA
ncbi:MAG: cyclodeaminase/cyclohydrolase family protein [Candidatus Limivicinus sp.]|jgi:formiminotetrahydrofolate cyclodeaminase